MSASEKKAMDDRDRAGSVEAGALTARPETGPLPPGVPEGALRVGEGLYLVRLQRPVDGCPAYRVHAVDGMAVQALYFRHPDGRFRLERPAGGC